MADPFYEGEKTMKCSIQGCPGTYEARTILHVVRRKSEVLVFEDVPAEVCDVCGDTLLAPDTIRHLEKIMDRDVEPRGHAPIFQYA